MDQLPINELIDFAKRIFYSGLVGSARFMGLAIFFPLFSWIQLRGILKNVVLVALSVPNIAYIYFSLGNGATPGVFVAVPLILKETAIGAVLGMLLGLPFWAAQTAGDVTDSFRGASASNLTDPVNANEASVSGTFFMLYTLTMFMMIGGLHMLIDILMQTYAIWPSTQLSVTFNIEAFSALAEVAARSLLLALVLGGPLLIALALADITLVFAGRSGRSFPIFDLTNTFHNLIFIFVMPVFAMLFAEHFPPILRTVFLDIEKILPTLVK